MLTSESWNFGTAKVGQVGREAPPIQIRHLVPKSAIRKDAGSTPAQKTSRSTEASYFAPVYRTLRKSPASRQWAVPPRKELCNGRPTNFQTLGFSTAKRSYANSTDAANSCSKSQSTTPRQRILGLTLEKEIAYAVRIEIELDKHAANLSWLVRETKLEKILSEISCMIGTTHFHIKI
jgi:hypothetical protein